MIHKFLLYVFVLCIFSPKLSAESLDDDYKTYYVPIDSKGTYLYVDTRDGPEHGDRKFPPTTFDLISLMDDPEVQLEPGDLIGLSFVGGFKAGVQFPDGLKSLMGVFSNGVSMEIFKLLFR